MVIVKEQGGILKMIKTTHFGKRHMPNHTRKNAMGGTLSNVRNAKEQERRLMDEQMVNTNSNNSSTLVST